MPRCTLQLTCFRLSERKIDLIERRLDEVTHLLQALCTCERPQCTALHQNEENSETTIQYQMPTASSTTSGHVIQSASHSPVVEGNSSLATHSSFANDYLQNAIRTNSGSLLDSNPEMGDILNHLHQIIDNLKQRPAAIEMPFSRAGPVRNLYLHECKLPPIEKVASLIRNVSSEPLQSKPTQP